MCCIRTPPAQGGLLRITDGRDSSGHGRPKDGQEFHASATKSKMRMGMVEGENTVAKLLRGLFFSLRFARGGRGI